MILTRKEIEQMCGYKQAAAQIRWLKHMGISFFVDRWGNPLTSQVHMDSVLGQTCKQAAFDGYRSPLEKEKDNENAIAKVRSA